MLFNTSYFLLSLGFSQGKQAHFRVSYGEKKDTNIRDLCGRKVFLLNRTLSFWTTNF